MLKHENPNRKYLTKKTTIQIRRQKSQENWVEKEETGYLIADIYLYPGTRNKS